MAGTLDLKKAPSERELFLSALERPLLERAEFLKAACKDNAALYKRVTELLGEQAGVGEFLEKPAIARAAPDPVKPATGPGGTAVLTGIEKVGDRIGRYKLLQTIGEGGCGVVYMAEQEEPVRRRVAVKVIKLGMDTKSVIARFEAERQALAMMDHPNIARVLDAGATETGRPYFVMELVRGIRITEYCDQDNLSNEARLKLFIFVCQALQHAHQKGIIHRDIKPSNILVTLHDGQPVPKVIDFGIAKATDQRLTDKTLFTEFQAFIGTPAYTSPEQAEMSGLDIDTRSDIYSLGVLLYELLTGQTPFDPERLLRSGLNEMRRIIREEEPLRPSTRLGTLGMAEATAVSRGRHLSIPALAQSVRGDLDWIVMRCLEKDRGRRYETANALAMDVQRFLENEPVLARPPSNIYRLQKMLRRHRVVFAATTAVALALVAGAAVSLWQAVRATRAEANAIASEMQESLLRRQAELEGEHARRENAAARVNEYVADINLAFHAISDGHLGRAVHLLDKLRPAANQQDLRGFEWRYLWQLCRGDEHVSFPDQDGPVQSITVSPDGTLLACGVRDKIEIWNISSHSKVNSISCSPAKGPGSSFRPGPPDRPGGVPFGFRGGEGAAFVSGGSKFVTSGMGDVRIWNSTDWNEFKKLPGAAGPVATSADGSRIAAMKGDFPDRRSVAIWDTSNWTELRSIAGATGPIALSADGKWLAANSDKGIAVWQIDNPEMPVLLENSTNVFSRGGPRFASDHILAISPDANYVVAARNTVSERGVFVMSIWDAKSGKEIAVLPDDPEHVEHTGSISCLAFSPDGKTLATASLDYSIRLWDFAKRERVAILQGHLSEVWSLAFLPDGQSLVSGAKDGSVKLWSTTRKAPAEVLARASTPLAFSSDGRTMAALQQQNSIALLDLETGQVERSIQLESGRGFRGGFRPRPGQAVSISADLRRIAQGLDDGIVKIWDTETGDTNLVKVSNHPVDLAVLSPDGRYLVASSRDQALQLWDLRTSASGTLDTEAQRVQFSPDGRLLACFGRANKLEFWETAAHRQLTNIVLEAQPGIGAQSAFSPDSRLMAVVCQDDGVHLLDLATFQTVGIFTGHKQPLTSVAFSPDGKTLATASEDSTMKLWNVASRQELLSVRRLGSAMFGLLFSPDGSLLVGGTSPFAQTSGIRFYRAAQLGDTEPVKTAAAR